MHYIKILGHLRSSGGIVHFAFSPFDCAVVEKTALVTNLWWTGVTVGTRARLIKRLFIGAAGGWGGVCVCSIIIVMRSECNMGVTIELAFVITAITLFVNFLGGLAA